MDVLLVLIRMFNSLAQLLKSIVWNLFRWYDFRLGCFRADIGSDGTWKSLSVEQGLGDESFQVAYQTPSGTIIYAGLMTNQMFIGEENLTGYDEDTTYVGTDVILAEFDFRVMVMGNKRRK